jgi:hypothetical protein
MHKRSEKLLGKFTCDEFQFLRTKWKWFARENVVKILITFQEK